jgi:hypothetical protein
MSPAAGSTQSHDVILFHFSLEGERKHGFDKHRAVAYLAETTEAFSDGHMSAFAFFGGVPRWVFYDNLKIAVAKIAATANRADAGVHRVGESSSLPRPVWTVRCRC